MSDRIDEILTIDDVATYLNAGKRTVYRLAASGDIPALNLDGTWRFRLAELDQWIDNRPSEAKQANDAGGNK